MTRDELTALGIGEEAIEAIIAENDAIREEYEEKLRVMKRENEIDLFLRESGARNLRAVKALLDDGDDYKEQIEKLKRSEDTRFLFDSGKKTFTPYRSGERLPDTKMGEYEARLNAARQTGNTVEAIRIKQQAASEGIMLI